MKAREKQHTGRLWRPLSAPCSALTAFAIEAFLGIKLLFYKISLYKYLFAYFYLPGKLKVKNLHRLLAGRF